MKKSILGTVAASAILLAAGATVYAVSGHSTRGIQAQKFAPGESDAITAVASPQLQLAGQQRLNVAARVDDSGKIPAGSASLVAYQKPGTNGTVHLKWEPVTTYSDGTPLPADAEVFYIINSDISGFTKLETTVPNINEIDIKCFDSLDEQTINVFGVWSILKTSDPENDAFNSEHPEALAFLGPAYTQPFLHGWDPAYNWPSGQMFNVAASSKNHSYVYKLIDPLPGNSGGSTLTNLSAYDAREGAASIGFYPFYAGDETDYYFARVKLDDAPAQPFLRFYHSINKNGEGDDRPTDNWIDVYVWCEGVGTKIDRVIPNTDRGWTSYTASLADWAGKEIQMMLRFCCPTDPDYIYVDELSIENAGGYDLSMTNITAPQSVAPGEEFELIVGIENIGGNNADGYNVTLYRDGDMLEEQSGLPVIGAGDYIEVKFTDRLPLDGNDSYTYRAKLTWERDEDTSNNMSLPTTVTRTMGDYPNVTGVTVSKEYQKVNVSWTAPATTKEVVGYMIYRDKDLLTPTPVTGTTYTDENPMIGTWVYAVAPVYSIGQLDAVAAEPIEIVRADIGYPAPSGLTAENDEKGVALAWISPQDRFNTQPTTEGFEDYEPWLYQPADLAPWTIVDIDESPAAENYPGTTFGRGNLMSFFTVDGTDLAGDFQAHKGKMFLSTQYNSDDFNKEWLISPELAPGGQTINFWASCGQYGYSEVVAVYYSTTDTSIEAFKANAALLDEVVDNDGVNIWKNYRVTLPADAKYFAIANESENPWYLKLDDITYIPAAKANLRRAPAVDNDVVTGFNVYRNGEKIAENVAADTYLDETASAGTYTYTVTAIYNGDYETEQSAPVEITLTADDVNLIAPKGLTATTVDATIELEWLPASVWAANSVAVTEDFESYPATKVSDEELGVWYVKNANGAEHSSGSQMFAPWVIVDNTGTDGSKALVTTYAAPIDDWLVSPEISPLCNTISFMGYSKDSSWRESMEVLVSYDDDRTDLDKFVKVAEFIDMIDEPTVYTVDIPQGAKYFALRAVSNDKLELRIDDITYVPAVLPAEAANAAARVASPMQNINIYRDGELIGTADKDATKYVDVDPLPGKSSTYQISAVYAAGESALSNEASAYMIADPKPTSVTASKTAEGMMIQWTAADLAMRNLVPVVEDWENYPEYSAKNGMTDLSPWTLVNRSGLDHNMGYQAYEAWTLVENKGVDDSMVLFSAYVSGQNDDWLISPLLNGAPQTISFDVKTYNASYEERVQVLYTLNPDATAPEGTDIDEYGDWVVIGDWNEIYTDWENKSFKLPEGAQHFAIRYFSNDVYGVYIDNISYIPAAFNGPAQVLRDLKGYNVYCNDTLLNDSPVADCSYLHDALNGAGDYTFHVTAVFAYSESDKSESTSVTVNEEELSLLPVSDLEGNSNEGEDGAVLTWSAPAGELEILTKTVTDDFESYAEGAADGTLGPWTLVNANGASHGNTTANQGQGTAPWYIVDNAAYANSGTKALMTTYSAPNIDDWIISPMIDNLSEVSFDARLLNDSYPDKFQLMVSYTNNQTSSFELFKQYAPTDEEFATYKETMPAGVKYFAIVDQSEDLYGIIIDNLSYTTVAEMLRGSLKGFNIYRRYDGPVDDASRVAAMADGLDMEGFEKVNDAPVTDTTFAEKHDLKGIYSYVVSAVYPWGESLMSDPVQVVSVNSGIENVSAAASDVTYRYYTVQGVQVSNPTPGQVYIQVGSDGSTRKVYVK